MSTNNITLQVSGMTCDHCVASVTEELSEIGGVGSVKIDLNAGGISHVTLTTTAPVERSVFEAAIAEAGYSLVTAAA